MSGMADQTDGFNQQRNELRHLLQFHDRQKPVAVEMRHGQPHGRQFGIGYLINRRR